MSKVEGMSEDHARRYPERFPSPADTGKLGDEIDALATKLKNRLTDDVLSIKSRYTDKMIEAVDGFAESIKRLFGDKRASETRDEFMNRQLREGHDRYELENKDDPVKRLSGKGMKLKEIREKIASIPWICPLGVMSKKRS